MKPVNVGGHAAYQDRVLSQLRKYYPDAASSLPAHTWDIMEKFWNLDLSEVDSLMQDRYSVFGPEPRLPSDMLRSVLVSVEFKVVSYTKWAADLKENYLHAIISGFPVGDTPGVGTFADFFSRLWISGKNNLSDPVHVPKEKPQKPKEKAPPVDKLTVEDLFRKFEEDPPQDMEPCKRIILDSAHDAMPYYQYCMEHGITPFIDLNSSRGRPPVYKEDFTINSDGVPVCPQGYTMRRDGTEKAKGRTKFKYPKISFDGGKPVCTCESPCSDAKYGRTVHLVMKDNPRLFNDPPLSSKEWKMEFNARTSSERCNKRQKIDYKLEDGRYRSSKMWYCRLFSILMHGLCQRLQD